MEIRIYRLKALIQWFVLQTFIHSFIHLENLYSAPSRKLLRGASSPTTVKKISFKQTMSVPDILLGCHIVWRIQTFSYRGRNNLICFSVSNVYFFVGRGANSAKVGGVQGSWPDFPSRSATLYRRQLAQELLHNHVEVSRFRTCRPTIL